MRRFNPAYVFCLLAPVALAVLPARAEDAAPARHHFPGDQGAQKGPPQPIDITADSALEWHQKERLYVARGHASATRGRATLYGDRIAAYERDVAATSHSVAHAVNPPSPAPATGAAASPSAKPGVGPAEGNTEIWRIVADGHVRLVNRRDDGKVQEAFGDHAVYDLDRELSVLTGKNLRGQSEDSLVTARDSLEYWQGLNLAIARGNAMAYDRTNQRKVLANTLTAFFKDDQNGQQKLDHAEADGHVVIVTPDDYATADHGRYNPDDDKAWLSGHVHLTHGKSQMNGDAAEMDFQTGIDRMSKDPEDKSWSQGRVEGLLVPESQPKKGAAAGSATAPAVVPVAVPVAAGGQP